MLSCELGPSDSVAVMAPKGKTPAGRAATYPPTDARGRVNHVDAGSTREDLPIADDVRHVDMALDAALLELHVVLREGASLVCEDVLHLWTKDSAGWSGQEFAQPSQKGRRSGSLPQTPGQLCFLT